MVEDQLADFLGHRPEQLVALLRRQLAALDHATEQDLDVHLVVAAVDAGRVVDGVGVDQPAGERVLDAAELGETEVAALAHHPAAQLAPVDAEAVVGPVADLGVRLGARLDVRADAAVPQQVDGRPKDRRHELVGGQRRGACDAEGCAGLGLSSIDFKLRGNTPPPAEISSGL